VFFFVFYSQFVSINTDTQTAARTSYRQLPIELRTRFGRYSFRSYLCDKLLTENELHDDIHNSDSFSESGEEDFDEIAVGSNSLVKGDNMIKSSDDPSGIQTNVKIVSKTVLKEFEETCGASNPSRNQTCSLARSSSETPTKLSSVKIGCKPKAKTNSSQAEPPKPDVRLERSFSTFDYSRCLTNPLTSSTSPSYCPESKTAKLDVVNKNNV